MATDERLKQMVDAAIDNKDQEAEIFFSSYLEDKLKQLLDIKKATTVDTATTDQK